MTAVSSPQGLPTHDHRGGPPEAWDRARAFSLLRVGALLLRYRRAFMLLPIVCAALAVVLALLAPPRYTSEFRFMPQTQRGDLSRLSGLAAQFGVAVPGGQSAETPEFYDDLLRSREILGPVVDTAFTLRGGRHASLAALLGVSEPDSAVRRERTIDRLRQMLQSTIGLRTNVVSVIVVAPDADVAQQVGARIVDRLNEFNLASRQASAAAERRFIEARVAEARLRVNAAEARLREFLETNRSWDNAPDLQFAKERLEREWQFQSNLYASLAQSAEQARIDAVRNTPAITVVQRPSRPPRRDSRRTAAKAVVGLTLGLLLAALWAITREYVRREGRHAADEFAEFDGLRRQTASDLRRPWRLFLSPDRAPVDGPPGAS